MVTSGEDRFDVRLAARAGGRVRTAIIRNDRAFSCRGLRGGLEVEADRVSMLLPTACLGAPRWVRVAVTADGVEDTSSEEHPYDFEMYFDDANSDTIDTRNWPVVGPRVRRG